jgi:signal transduction histidine kinase
VRTKGITLDEVISTLYAPYAYEPERVPVLVYSCDRNNSGISGNSVYVKRYKELYGNEVIMKPLEKNAAKNKTSYESGGSIAYLEGTRKMFSSAAVESAILVAVYADNQFQLQMTDSPVFRYELTAAIARYGSLLAGMFWALALVLLCPLVVVGHSAKWNRAMEFLAGNGMVLEFRLLIVLVLFGLSGYGAYRFQQGSAIGCYTLGVAVLAVTMVIAMLHQFVKNRPAITKDTIAGRLATYTANQCAKKRELYHELGMGYHLQRNTLYFVVQLSGLLVVEAVLLVCYVCFGTSWSGIGGISSGVCYAVAAVVVLLLLVLALVHYLRFINSYVCGIEGIQQQLELFGQGDFETKVPLPKQFYGFASDEEFNAIKQGVLIAMENEMKSERMKLDLVTNVSHDIKTPLTSIVNYVDLLADSDQLPQVEADYVKVLQRKSYRLRDMIQDLFDLSKATSGNLATEFAELDFAKLVQQTLADMDEQIAISSLTFRCDLEPELKIYSDGSRLYRVIQNLLVNVLKYSMDNSRVYVTLKRQGANAVLTIKNMSRQEMNFTKEQVLERFFRGDTARSTEGSGLGVAIANSFTEVCGGQFDIEIDADLFCAIVSMPLIERELSELSLEPPTEIPILTD